MSRVTLHEGDNRDSLHRLLDQGVRVHSVVTDPPYGLTSITKRFGKEGSSPARTEKNDGSFARLSGGFMGKAWDGTGIERDPEFWRLIYEILLPGGYCFAFSGSRTGHWQACAMEMAGFIMHPMHGWVFGCLDTSSQCLTRRGWLYYTELLPDDEVAQWDSATNTLSWVRPEAVHEYDFDGEMVNLKNRHTDQLLTPNHRVYAKVQRHSRHAPPAAYEVLDADAIDRRSSCWRVTLPMAAPLIEGDRMIDPESAYLAGWWMTDAWPHQDANACMFSQSKPETLDRLRAALAPYNPSEYVKKGKLPTHRDEYTFYLTGPMADWLRSHFPDRKLPWSVLSWDREARQRLYDGLMDGDGSNADTNSTTGIARHAHTFWSKDQDRRDVFVALALSLGHRAYEDATKGAVYVNVETATTELQTRHRAERVRYTGKVWCLTVPTGAFVARRNGRPFITGNSGFPKAHAADKALVKSGHPGDAAAWEGWAYGTQAQKPALEPIYLGQKPFSEKTGAANLLKHGVGAVNIDGCRVPGEPPKACKGTGWAAQDKKNAEQGYRPSAYYAEQEGVDYQPNTAGRHPANLILDGSDEVVALFPHTKSGKPGVMRKGTNDGACYGAESRAPGTQMTGFGDEDSAARFFHQFTPDADPLFYHPKAGKADRAGSKHPTVKPVALMQYLIRHITPPGGIVLDPFAGSGTTAEAARREGFDCILMEAEPEYIEFLRQRFDLPSPDDDFDSLITSDDFEALLA